MLLLFIFWYLVIQAVFSVVFVWLLVRYYLRTWSAPTQTKSEPTFANMQNT